MNFMSGFFSHFPNYKLPCPYLHEVVYLARAVSMHGKFRLFSDSRHGSFYKHISRTAIANNIELLLLITHKLIRFRIA